MKLEAYIKEAGITCSAFAEMAETSKSNVSKWISGQIRPSPSHYIKIHSVTNGRVTPNDFYDFS